MSCHHIDFIAFDIAAEDLDGLALDDPFAELGGIIWASSGSRFNSWPICSFERFNPRK